MKKYCLTVLAFLLIMSQASLIHADVIIPKVHSVSSENPVSGRRAANTVNGSGLSDDGTHSAAEGGVVWTSLGTIGARDFAPYIVYDLGSVQYVTGMHIWNYNSSATVQHQDPDAEASMKTRSFSNIGAKEVEVLTSADGQKFISRGIKNFEMASGKNGDKGQKIKVDYPGVRYVKFVIKNTHQGTVFDGSGRQNGDYDGRALTGLSEVRFIVPSRVSFQFPEQPLKIKEGVDEGVNYKVRLTEKPKKGMDFIAVPVNVSLKLNGLSAGEAAVIHFDEGNWNQWQTVMVRATDDSIDLVNHKAIVTHFYRNAGCKDAVRLSQEVSIRIEDNDETVVEKLEPIDPAKRMEWFSDIKYYWFIHWGPSSLGGGEISFSRGGIGKEKYDQFYKKFNPTGFDAEEWVRIAKAAGLKTIVFTAKHCDGFAMWDTKAKHAMGPETYSIMETPFKRDVVKELSDACKKHGLRFSLYYSVMDWYHPDWPHPFVGGPGYSLPAGALPKLDRYIEHMKTHISELYTNYGDIALKWWDGTDGRDFFAPVSTWGPKQAKDMEAFARKLQPAIVMSNRVGHWDGNDIRKNWWVDDYGDYDSNEMERVEYQEKPWEYTWKLGTQWAWRPNDTYKSKKTMIRDYIIKIVGNNGNFLMDVSPGPTGKFEPEVVTRLTDIGNWMKLHGESIYATRGGPYISSHANTSPWGYSTRKGDKVYLHVLNWPSNNQLTLPSLGKKVVKSRVMTGGSVKLTQANADSSITLEVPSHYQKEIDTIIALELEGSAMDIQPIKTN